MSVSPGLVSGRQVYSIFGNGRHVAYFLALPAVSEDDVLFSRDYINPVCLAMRVGLLDHLCMHMCA